MMLIMNPCWWPGFIYILRWIYVICCQEYILILELLPLPLLVSGGIKYSHHIRSLGFSRRIYFCLKIDFFSICILFQMLTSVILMKALQAVRCCMTLKPRGVNEPPALLPCCSAFWPVKADWFVLDLHNNCLTGSNSECSWFREVRVC